MYKQYAPLLLSPSADGKQLEITSESFECWYFDTSFDDGSTAVIVYRTKMDESGGPLQPNVVIAITQPDGTTHQSLIIYPSTQFKAKTETCDISIGPNRVAGDLSCYVLHAEGDGLVADLMFNRIAPSRAPANSMCTPGWFAAIPYGIAEGTLTYNGQTHSVKGGVYHDHTWGMQPINTMLLGWYWGRAHIGQYTLVFAQSFGTPGSGNVQERKFYLAYGNELLTTHDQILEMQPCDTVRFLERESSSCGLELDCQTEQGSLQIHLHPSLVIADNHAASLSYTRFQAHLCMKVSMGGHCEVIAGPAIYEVLCLL